MKASIFKFPLELGTGIRRLKLPISARILSVADQCGKICLWAECRSSQDFSIEIEYMVVGTGWEVELDNWRFLGTCFQLGGTLVWHIYWRPT